ncbi:hypothetical protein HDU85_004537 [Gaertneriomyces sp. JEL0708]|nr:hypothetical protein HDU85_004537 [Gaertneriomyces sp. JEL0708]
MTTTVTLDSDSSADISRISHALYKSKRCIVVTGAGISVSGGIPDFRSSDGLYNIVKQRFPTTFLKGKDLFDASLFRSEESTMVFYSFMAELKRVIEEARVTRAHEFIGWLKERGGLLRCYTQNIDCLEHRLPEFTADVESSDVLLTQTSTQSKSSDTSAAAKIVQLHGDLNTLICTICSATSPFTADHTSHFLTGTPPECPDCLTMAEIRSALGKRPLPVGTLRPNIVLYNEHHKSGDHISQVTSLDIRKRPDMLIVMGTSLKVFGIKKLVKDVAKVVKDKGGIVVLVNMSEIGKEWDGVFDYWVKGDCDDACEAIRRGVETLEINAAERREKLKRMREKKEMKQGTLGFVRTTPPPESSDACRAGDVTVETSSLTCSKRSASVTPQSMITKQHQSLKAAFPVTKKTLCTGKKPSAKTERLTTGASDTVGETCHGGEPWMGTVSAGDMHRRKRERSGEEDLNTGTGTQGPLKKVRCESPLVSALRLPSESLSTPKPNAEAFASTSAEHKTIGSKTKRLAKGIPRKAVTLGNGARYSPPKTRSRTRKADIFQSSGSPLKQDTLKLSIKKRQGVDGGKKTVDDGARGVNIPPERPCTLTQ